VLRICQYSLYSCVSPCSKDFIACAWLALFSSVPARRPEASQKASSSFQVRVSTDSIGLLSMIRPGALSSRSPPVDTTVSTSRWPVVLPDQACVSMPMSPWAEARRPNRPRLERSSL
jgi:hypothetical protein